MANGARQKKLEEDIPSNYPDKFANVSRESWKHEDFRKKVISIFNDHMAGEHFQNKVWEYFLDFLRDESFSNKVKSISGGVVKDYIDKSRVKSVFWMVGLILAAIIGLLLQKFFNIF